MDNEGPKKAEVFGLKEKKGKWQSFAKPIGRGVLVRLLLSVDASLGLRKALEMEPYAKTVPA
jgi:hypothetical protein